MTFWFQSYIRVLKDCFTMLADDERPVTECDKLDYLLDNIQNVNFSSAISNISMMAALQSSFEEATNILMREVQQLFPLAANKGKQTIAQMEAEHDITHTIGATGCGRGGRGCGFVIRAKEGALSVPTSFCLEQRMTPMNYGRHLSSSQWVFIVLCISSTSEMVAVL